jgi:chemotaxis family two-component system response regulator PixH
MTRILLVSQKCAGPDPRKHILESNGYSVTLVHDSQLCMDAIADSPPRLLILDVLIDGRNGFEVCRLVRGLLPADRLPIILCSDVYRSSVFRREASDVGAQLYMLTPIDMDELMKHVHSLTHGVAAKT